MIAGYGAHNGGLIAAGTVGDSRVWALHGRLPWCSWGGAGGDSLDVRLLFYWVAVFQADV